MNVKYTVYEEYYLTTLEWKVYHWCGWYFETIRGVAETWSRHILGWCHIYFIKLKMYSALLLPKAYNSTHLWNEFMRVTKHFLQSIFRYYNNRTTHLCVKPGSSTSELKDSAIKRSVELLLDDLIVICSGTNDYELNEFSLTLKNITNFVKSNNHTNIILMNVPFRYDLPSTISVNMNISILKRMLQKLGFFSHSSFLEMDNNRNLFTNHGLHLNKLGRRLVNHHLASFIQSTFKQKTIILGWHETQNDSNLTCDVNRVKTYNRNSSCNRKILVTRSKDFYG